MKFTRYVTLSALVAWLSSCGTEKVSHLKETIPNPGQTDLVVGSGYDALSGETKDRCLKPTALTRAGGQDSQSQSVTFQLKRVDSYIDLQSELQMSASGTYRSGIYKHSARVQYMRSLKYNSFSSFMLVSVKVVNATETLEHFDIKPAARELLQKSPESFYRICGDRFISGRTTGGELLAVVEFHSTSREEKERVDARIRSGGGVFQAAGDFHRAISEMSRLATVNITTIRNGGTGKLPAITDLADAALQFPEQMAQKEKPWVYSFQTHDYNLLSTSTADPFPLNRQKAFLEASVATRSRALALRNDIEYVLSKPDEFEKLAKSELKKLESTKKRLEDIIFKYDQQALLCFSDPRDLKNCTFPDVSWGDVHLPKRKASSLRQFREGELCELERLRLLQTGAIDAQEFAIYAKFNMSPQYNKLGSRSSGINEWVSCEETEGELLVIYRKERK